jgi:uncharacterized protein YndB with AHSA1/START domain
MTNQTPKSIITPDNDAVVTEIEIAVPPQRVFHALIDRDQALQWGNSDAFEMTLWEMDARPGGKAIRLQATPINRRPSQPRSSRRNSGD